MTDARSQKPPAARFKTRAADFLLVVLIAALWQAWFYQDVTRALPVSFDAFRDAAAAENILAGGGLSDPAIPDAAYWYAPLSPILVAALSRWFDVPPLLVYSYSILWLNVLAPLAWYALARRWSGPWPALAGVVLIVFGSRWWTICIAAPGAGMQGVVLMTIALIAWTASLRSRKRWPAVFVGALLAACTWLHIVSGIIAAAAVGLHALWCARAGRAEDDKTRRREAVKRMCLIASICGVLVAPLALHLMQLERLNPRPAEYLSRELHDPAFALQADTPLVPLLALVGFIPAWRRRPDPIGLAPAYAAVGLAGQAWGYLRLMTGWNIPVLPPHEFQFHFQAAVGLLAAYGLWWIATTAAARFTANDSYRSILRIALTAIIVYLAVGGEFKTARAFQSHAWHAAAPFYRTSLREAIEWIKAETSVEDVVFSPHPYNYTLVGGATGRKLVAAPVGQTNIAANAARRVSDAERLENSRDPDECAALLAQYRVKYVLLLEEHAQLARRWSDWGLLTRVHQTSAGTATVYRVVQK